MNSSQSVRRHACLLLLAALSLPARSPAQTPKLRFEPLSLEQGVSHNLVYAIHQDRNGFMWFGTMYGLVKYDGRRYTCYRHEARDPHSLSFNDIIAIHEDAQGALWIGTWGGGLNRFDPVTETATRFLHEEKDPTSLSDNTVWAIASDPAGDLWVGTNRGLDRLPGATRLEQAEEGARLPTRVAFLHYTFKFLVAGRSGNPIVRSLQVDGRGRLWVGTLGGGLHLFDRARSEFVTFRHDPNNPRSLSRNAVNSIYEDQAGTLWIGTLGGGLNRMQHSNDSVFAAAPTPEGAAFIHFRHDPADPFSLSQDEIGPMVEDRNGDLWIGTSAAGLNKLERSTGRFHRHQHDPADRYSLSSNAVVALCHDRSGILWIGSYQGGVAKLVPHQQSIAHVQHEPANDASLSHDDVRALCQDRAGTLWVGTFGGGLNELPARASGDFVHHRATSDKPAALRSNFITSLLEDRHGNLWIGSLRGGLTRWERSRTRFTHFQHQPQEAHSLSHDNVSVIYEDRDGDLWVGTEGGGLNRLAAGSAQFKHYRHDPANPGSLSNDFVHTLLEDRNGVLWIGTYRGLSRFDRQSESFVTYRHRLDDPASLSNDYVYALHEDGAGNLWVGTSDGLNKFDPAHQRFEIFTEADGLPNGVVCGMLEEEAGGLWLSTQKGLSRFDPRTRQFRNYEVADGLQSNMFNLGAFCQGAGGEMFWGGINGFNRFHPALLPHDTLAPQIALTSLRVFNQPRPLTGRPLRLRHDENFITLEFAALHFARPEKNEYAYRLEGFDREWIACGTRNSASYTGLPPGRYVFRVKGSNGDGVWNETGAAVALVITPPFWRTWWFYGGVSVLLAASLVLWHRARLRQVRARVAEIARIKNEEQLARLQAVEQARREERERVRRQIAADFHDESGHKLTKISLFCGVLQARLRQGAQDLDEYAGRIMAVAASLHKDISDFIWALDPAENTLHDAALKLKDFGEKLFDHTGIRFRLEGLTPALEQVVLPMEVRQNLTCIFKEGMNNILKHTRDDCREVRCAFAAADGQYAVTLSDDGKGFDAGRCPPGKGLYNMQRRARAVQGELQVISREGKGTAIRLVAQIPAAEAGRADHAELARADHWRPRNGKHAPAVAADQS